MERPRDGEAGGRLTADGAPSDSRLAALDPEVADAPPRSFSPSPDHPLPAGVESRPGLLRALGPGMAIAMVVGNVIGSGIFVKPGLIAAEAGSFSIVLTAWITGGVLCLLGALCFAELAVMLPRAGGLYVYLREAYGRTVAFLFGWIEFLFGKPASTGALAFAAVTVFEVVIDHRFLLPAKVGIVVGLIAGLSWINILGVIWGGRFQALTTLIKAGLVAGLAVLPFALLAGGSDGVQWTNYASTAAPRSGSLTTQFGAVLLAVMWAYNGWHGVTPVAEEIRRPQRNIPLALFGGIGLLILLYVSVNVAYHGVLTMREIADAGEAVPQAMMRRLFGPATGQWLAAGLAAGIVCSMVGAMNSNIMNAPRVSFAMGRDDVFFRQLGRVHVNYRTPAIAIAVQAIMAGLLVVSSGVLVTFYAGFEKRSIFDMLTDYVIFSASIFYMLAVLAVFVLRRRRPGWERPYRTLGYPVVPALYVAFYAWFLYRILIDKPFESGVGLALIALGLPAYWSWQAWSRRHPPTGE